MSSEQVAARQDDKYGVVVFSSEGSKTLATAVEKVLGDGFHTTVWTEAFHPSKTFLEELFKVIRESDFSVVLFTRDDVRMKDGQKGKVPRDNCVFEHGACLGEFGEDGRAFLLNSVEKENTPTDLHSFQWISFKEPANRNNLEQCKVALKNSCDTIRQRIEAKMWRSRGRLKTISPTQLKSLEGTGQGQNLEPGTEVMVRAVQPIEQSDWSFAARIKRNMLDEQIKYHYFFEKGQGQQYIAQLIRALVLSPLPAAILAKPTYRELVQLCEVPEKRDALLASLEEVSKLLYVHFVPFTSETFCIHSVDKKNAADHPAKGYLFLDGQYFLLSPTDTESKIEVYKKYRRADDASVFGDTTYVPLAEVRPPLEGELRRAFGNLGEAVIGKCFPVKTAKPTSDRSSR